MSSRPTDMITKTSSETGRPFIGGEDASVGDMAHDAVAAAIANANPGGKSFVGAARPILPQAVKPIERNSHISYITELGRFISIIAEHDGWVWGKPCTEFGLVHRTEPPISIEARYCSPVR